MKRALLFALALCGCQQQPAPFAFQNASITLPEPAVALPPGPNAELVTAVCTACHSADMMLYQPALGEKDWAKTIDKMRAVYKASIDPADEAKVIAYLVSRPVETAR